MSDIIQNSGDLWGTEMDRPLREPVTPRLIGIVAASGGPAALGEILGGLPPDFPVPILVVQSVHPDFLEKLVMRLNDRCLLQVIAARDGQVPEPGRVYVASDDPGLLVVQHRLRLERRDSRSHDDSKNALFRSMARDQGSGAVAVILTALAPDGVEGMKAVRDAGGYTIVQDQATSVIYGPAEIAVRLDAVCESLPLQEIAPRLLSLMDGGASDRWRVL
jgi:two-component system, chemotaxis family, protein-glutamate methylesterase/glutaminase